MFTQPGKEHEWLKRFVGEWSISSECVMEPGKPPTTVTGTEKVRMLGDLWLLCEGMMEMPGGQGSMQSLMTLGYDPAKKKFVGTWIGAMMGNLFVYEGDLDAAQRVLPLNTTGPSFTEPGKMAKFQDVIELHSNDKRLLWSQMQDEQGKWHKFMSATYTRVK